MVNVWDFVGKETAKFSVKFSKALEFFKHTVELDWNAKLSSAKLLGRAPTAWGHAEIKKNPLNISTVSSQSLGPVTQMQTCLDRSFTGPYLYVYMCIYLLPAKPA